jgi:VCBS repeat-containing protein
MSIPDFDIDDTASSFKSTYVEGFLDCSGNTLLRGNLILNTSTVSLGAGTSVGANSISIGLNAGNISSNESISIGENSGKAYTGYKNVTIGTDTNGIQQNGSNNIFIGYNTDSTNDVSNCIAIGKNAQTNFSNSVAIGVDATTTSSNQIVLGTTNENITIPGGISTNYITLLYSSVPTFTSNQIGFTVLNTINPASITTGAVQTLSTIDLSSTGIWLITFNITNGSFSTDTALDAEIYINSTRVSRSSGRGTAGSTNVSVEGTYIYRNNSNTNTTTLKAGISSTNSTITSPTGYFQAVRIA